MMVIVQNVACEGPGTVASYLSSHAIRFRVLRAFEGEEVPSSVEGVSHLVILGGPMSVYQEGEFPFLKDECDLIEEAIGASVPTVGICLGGQLIAKVLGATVERSPVKEIGWYNVLLTAEGRQDPLFEGSEEHLRVFQWHEDTFNLPEGAILLCRSDTCVNQAFRYGKNIYGVQFHIEVDGEMIGDWFDQYGGQSQMRKRTLAEYNQISRAFREQATRLYANFFR